MVRHAPVHAQGVDMVDRQVPDIGDLVAAQVAPVVARIRVVAAARRGTAASELVGEVVQQVERKLEALAPPVDVVGIGYMIGMNLRITAKGLLEHLQASGDFLA
ncbi:hypothetical protein D3C72_1796120 [compost metagenome]